MAFKWDLNGTVVGYNQLLTTIGINVVKNNAINYPFGNGNHSTYKNGDDWGMVQMALF